MKTVGKRRKNKVGDIYPSVFFFFHFQQRYAHTPPEPTNFVSKMCKIKKRVHEFVRVVLLPQ